jgi:hypothetical protein
MDTECFFLVKTNALKSKFYFVTRKWEIKFDCNKSWCIKKMCQIYKVCRIKKAPQLGGLSVVERPEKRRNLSTTERPDTKEKRVVACFPCYNGWWIICNNVNFSSAKKKWISYSIFMPDWVYNWRQETSVKVNSSINKTCRVLGDKNSCKFNEFLSVMKV